MKSAASTKARARIPIVSHFPKPEIHEAAEDNDPEIEVARSDCVETVWSGRAVPRALARLSTSSALVAFTYTVVTFPSSSEIFWARARGT